MTRVVSGAVAGGKAPATDPVMGPVVLGLVAAMAVVLALAAGVSWPAVPWPRQLHWAGGLLVLGISLAAKGISDVRRTWTSLPGLAGVIRARFEQARLWVADWRLLWLARALVGAASAMYRLDSCATVLGQDSVRPDGAADAERIAWLEDRLAAAVRRLDMLEASLLKETAALATATGEERAAREART